ncbi:MAG: hypothetical protein IKZ06_05155, partial [Oscillospiraceae bacterium]|nr:hypothetical protein [Oscillospiraceae bacterium]
MKIFPLLAYTFSHFAVDYLCFWILFGYFSNGVKEQALGFILYNFIAFGLQMVIGAYCDEHRRFPSSAIGCLLVLFAVLISPFAPWAAVITTALGNAFFHVGGGIESLVHSGGKLYRSGIFVSAGALGVAEGTLHGSKLAFSNVISPKVLIDPVLMALFCAVICYIANKKYPNIEDCEIKNTANEKIGIWIVLGLALLSVVIRSFGGTAIPMEWKTTMRLGLVSGFAAFLGKFIGGFAADFFGAKRTGIITLLASIPLLVFGSGNMAVSVIGIILFNMTMPITLGIVAQRLPKNPGIAFGLTTAALLFGAIPSFFALLSGKIYLLVPAVLISAICIYFSAENKKSVK